MRSGYDSEMPNIRVRLARAEDRAALARLCEALWPDSSAEEHAGELTCKLSGRPPGTLPLAILVSEASDGWLTGFIEVGLRSHAEGCDPARPAGYVEGWYVVEDCRGRGVGKTLLAAAEDWARRQGCVEMASDTWLDNELSRRVHESLGFQEVERAIHFRKALR
jgi:aminoglycoside 6'-N-acetyltransferase I